MGKSKSAGTPNVTRNQTKNDRSRKMNQTKETHIVGHEILVARRGETLPNKVADVAEDDKQQVADVRRQQDGSMVDLALHAVREVCLRGAR